jgi:iron complex outermembrane receptor protein
VYGKWFDRDAGADGADDWHMGRVGFRTDWHLSEADSLTVQGDYYNGKVGETATLPALTPPFSETFEAAPEVSGGNVLLRWEREYSQDSELALQLYYDRIERDSPFLGEERDSFDLDFQHRFPLEDRHDMLWGLGYRFTADDTEASSAVSLNPQSAEDHLFSAFVQDEITLLQDRLKLTLGSKFEHNDYTGFELQPNARLVWSPGERDTVWAAVSRAVRTPSRSDRGARIDLVALEVPDAGVGLVSVFANPRVASEDLLACELGYRTQPSDRLFLDVAGFYNRYDDLVAAEAALPFFEPSPSPPHVVLPFVGGNRMSGQTCGIEVASQWQVLDWWRVHAAYSYLMMDLDVDEDSGEIVSANDEGTSPPHQFSLRSMMDLPNDLELDWWLRYVDSLDSMDVGSYATLDLRLGWQPSEDFELSLVGQNLFESDTPQFGSSLVSAEATRVQRGVYAKATWRF